MKGGGAGVRIANDPYLPSRYGNRRKNFEEIFVPTLQKCLAVVEDEFCSMFMNADDVKEYFSKKRSFAASNNMHQHTWRRTAEGYLTVHDEKYGYLLTDDRKGLVIDEEVAPIIREIFHLLADKEMTYKQVCALMNERG